MRTPWLNKLALVFGPRPPISWLVLCLISVLALITVLGSSSSNAFEAATSTPAPDMYTNYRKLKEQAAVDYLELKSLSGGAGRVKELGLCGKERENFVPCYNVSANMLTGYKNGGGSLIVTITKDQFLSSGSMTKRMMLLEENQIAFHSDDGSIFDGVKDYSRQIAEMLGLGSDTEFIQAGVRTVLDIGCGFGSFGAHLLSLKVMAVCVAAYEATGSQVQMALERGLPAIISNFISRQLPYPTLSYDMVHCAQCGIVWDDKDGVFLLEVDRLLRPGGYFVLTAPVNKAQGSSLSTKKANMVVPLEKFTDEICWSLLAQQDDTFIWQKTVEANCYKSRKQAAIPLCKGQDLQSYYQPLVSCISGISSKHWTPIQNRSSGPYLSSAELELHGVQPDDFFEDLQYWRSSLKNYWSLLTPLIFSDHPKRPGDEDPLPPFNMVRNVMDMNAHYGGLNYAFLEEKKSVWLMNVVPVGAQNTLPLILEQGFAGVLHDWCEPFPTYPRTYDMLHANGLLSHLSSERCSMMDLLLEMDRILRPEGWVVLCDKMGVVELARMLATQIRWEARKGFHHPGTVHCFSSGQCLRVNQPTESPHGTFFGPEKENRTSAAA
ncbi:hypothetical protein NL676_037686 [Syzygium grande]|nr:hypothetical protein NL676_037686 [Syzygium grande]